jgi:tRNA(Ile)-lysidine synthetase-like protein
MAEDGQVGTEAILPGAVCLTVGYDDILLTGLNVNKPPLDLPQLPVAEPLPIPVPGRIKLEGGWAISAEISDEIDVDTVLDNQDPWQAFVALKEPFVLWVRPVHPGESFQPLGLEGRSAEVREVMINRKIPSAARDRWPVVANDDHLIWLVGHHLDNRSRITEQTIRKIKLVASREE